MKLIKSRLMLLGLAALFVGLATSRHLRHAIIRSGQAVTGAKIEVGRIITHWRTARVELRNVQAADPKRAMRNLFEAERIVLDVDPRNLLHRRILVERGQVLGLRIGTRRATSGKLDTMSPAAKSGGDSEAAARFFAEQGSQWFDTVSRRLTAADEPLHTSRQLAMELMKKWPESTKNLKQSAERTLQQVRQMEASLRDAGDNPLRNLSPYQTAVSSLESLGKEIYDVRGSIDRQQQQLLLDEEQFLAALRTDDQKLADDCGMPNLDGSALGKYLLAEEISQRTLSIIEWLRWGRQFVPALSRQTVPGFSRGRNIVFAGAQAQPDILLKTLVLAGEGDVDGARFQLEGTLSNLSSDPDLGSDPTELIVQTTGAASTAIHAEMRTVGGKTTDRIYIHCPHWSQPERQWGDPSQLALIASGGDAHLSILINLLDDDQLSGEIVIRQPELRLTPRLNAALSTDPIPSLLAEAVAEVKRLDVSVKLGGSLEFPKWELKSNFGGQLAASLERTFEKGLVERRSALAAAQRKETEARITALVAAITRSHQALATQLDGGDHSLHTIQTHIAERVRQNDGVVEPDSPLREVYRR